MSITIADCNQVLNGRLEKSSVIKRAAPGTRSLDLPEVASPVANTREERVCSQGLTMSGTTCCVPLCSQRGGHVFPKDPDQKRRWIQVIRRREGKDKRKVWQRRPSSVVCRELTFFLRKFLSETSFSWPSASLVLSAIEELSTTHSLFHFSW